MATFAECVRELRARRARLQEAEDGGWRDCIPSERETVRVFESAFMEAIDNHLDQLVAAAGEVDLGPLPFGVGLHYSAGEASAEPPAGPPTDPPARG